MKFAYIRFNSCFPCKLSWLVPISSSSTFSERECLGIRGAGRFCGMNWRQNKHKVLNPAFLRSPPNSGRNGRCSLCGSFLTPIPKWLCVVHRSTLWHYCYLSVLVIISHVTVLIVELLLLSRSLLLLVYYYYAFSGLILLRAPCRLRGLMCFYVIPCLSFPLRIDSVCMLDVISGDQTWAFLVVLVYFCVIVFLCFWCVIICVLLA